MKNILVYDDVAEKLEAIAELYDIQIWDIVEDLLNNGQEIIEDLYSE